jgi:hypothetical protein
MGQSIRQTQAGRKGTTPFPLPSGWFCGAGLSCSFERHRKRTPHHRHTTTLSDGRRVWSRVCYIRVRTAVWLRCAKESRLGCSVRDRRPRGVAEREHGVDDLGYIYNNRLYRLSQPLAWGIGLRPGVQIHCVGRSRAGGAKTKIVALCLSFSHGVDDLFLAEERGAGAAQHGAYAALRRRGERRRVAHALRR